MAERERARPVNSRRSAESDRQRLADLNVALERQIAENEALQARLTEQALRDPLTGLHNRRFLFEAALLTRMIAQQCDLAAHELVWTGGDVHLYLNHAELVEAQLKRIPEGAPKLRILRRPASIFDYRFEDFAVEELL